MNQCYDDQQQLEINIMDWCKGFMPMEVILLLKEKIRSNKKVRNVITSITNELNNRFFQDIWKVRCENQIKDEKMNGIRRQEKRRKKKKNKKKAKRNTE